MPGTITVAQQETFAAPPITVAVAPKLKFGTDVQEVNKDGEAKWTVQAAVTYAPQFGMKAVAEVIEVTVTGEDPSAFLAPGTPIEFNRLQVGVSAPEQRDNGRGGTRVSGGKLWFTAAGVRPVNGRQSAAA